MRHWESYKNKYGFDHGRCIPVEVIETRYVYLHVLNQLCVKNNSSVRFLGYDGPSTHNCYYIVCVPVSYYEQVVHVKGKKNDYMVGNDFSISLEVVVDRQGNKAITEAHNLDLDYYVAHKVSIRRGDLATLIKNLKEQ